MTIYERIGGETALNAVVVLFYSKVLGDPLLAPVFDGIDMSKQNGKQRTFFTALFKSEADDTDAYMRESHAHLVTEFGIGDAHFDAVAGHLQDTLNALAVPQDVVAEIMNAAASLRNAVLNR